MLVDLGFRCSKCVIEIECHNAQRCIHLLSPVRIKAIYGLGCFFIERIHARGGIRGGGSQVGAHGAYDPRRIDTGGVQQLSRLSRPSQVEYLSLIHISEPTRRS